LNAGDEDTRNRHDAIWREFISNRDVVLSSGRVPAPPQATIMLGFLISVSDQAILDRLGRAVRRFDLTGCLTPFPAGYWHITVVPPTLLTSGPPDPPKLLPESFTEEALERAGDAVRGYKPFTISVRGVNAFKDVVVAIPYDQGHSAELHRRLRTTLPQLPERYLDGYDPLPHISLAQYRNDDRIDELASELTALRDHDFGSFTATQIEMILLTLEDGVPKSARKLPIPFDRPR
jgi:2'-5' RNA ligase